MRILNMSSKYWGMSMNKMSSNAIFCSLGGGEALWDTFALEVVGIPILKGTVA
jgi:hypothetical protein